MNLYRSELAQKILALSPEEKTKFLQAIPTLSEKEQLILNYDWGIYARDNQFWPSGNWSGWLLLAGRAFGKTRSGAEAVRMAVESGLYSRVGLVAPTAKDLREIMVQTILDISPPWFMPNYIVSQSRLVWPNGAIGHLFSAEVPDRLRGPNIDLYWLDEIASYRFLNDVLDQAFMSLRRGKSPKWIASTTPRPKKRLKELINDPTVKVSTGKTFDNSGNLPANYIQNMVDKYKGTRVGRQELYAEILEDTQGALWDLDTIEKMTLHYQQVPKEFDRVVVGVDPSGGRTETGIIVTGFKDNRGYVLADYSCFGSPDVWAKEVATAFYAYKADAVIAEKNYGGDMVQAVLSNIPDNPLPVKLVSATTGKLIRAEPVSLLSKNERVFFHGSFPELETELTEYTGEGNSPNRLDAFVWTITDGLLQKKPSYEVKTLPVNPFYR